MKNTPSHIAACCLAFLLAIAALAGLSGCASADANNQMNLMSASGFRPLTPSTPKQNEIYNQLPDYKMETGIIKGQVLYGYKNPAQGVIYVGGEKEFQQYKQLGIQQSIAQDNLAAAQMNQSTMMGFGAWGGRSVIMR